MQSMINIIKIIIKILMIKARKLIMYTKFVYKDDTFFAVGKHMTQIY